MTENFFHIGCYVQYAELGDNSVYPGTMSCLHLRMNATTQFFLINLLFILMGKRSWGDEGFCARVSNTPTAGYTRPAVSF